MTPQVRRADRVNKNPKATALQKGGFDLVQIIVPLIDMRIKRSLIF